MKFLLHITQADRWPAALSNLKNLTQLGHAGNTVVVINGSGIYAVQGRSDLTMAMAEAAAAGVRLEICERAMANHQINKDDLPDWLSPVASAIPAIAEHVAQGFTYIKP